MINSTVTSMKFLTDSINSNLESVDNIANWAKGNTTISSYTEAKNNSKYGLTSLKAYDRLYEEYQNSPVNSMLFRVVIGNKYGRFIQVVPSQYSTNHDLGIEIPNLPYFNDLLESSQNPFSTGFLTDAFYTYSDKWVIPLVYPIYARYRSDMTGWIFIEVTQDIFTEPLEYYNCAPDESTYLVLGEHTYLITSDDVTPCDFSYDIEKVLSTDDDTYYAYRIHEYQTDKKSTIVISPLSQPDCYIIQTISNNEIKEQHRMLITIWVIIIVILLLIALLSVFILHHSIGKPIRKIRVRLNAVSRGDFKPDSSIEWNNELGDIGRGINKLSTDLEKLIETRIDDEKEKKDLEYKVLQNQINPHFLYNTLNSIKWMAAVQGADGIADMTTSLSRLLRSISKGTKLLIPLSEELSLVKDYFNIQNYRYGGTIKFDIECGDEHLLDALIIKFTLQPIVENAIFHGLEPKGNVGSIRVIIEKIPDDDLRIIVWDNGVGISKEKIDLILSDDTVAPSEFFKDIGISNVHKRLQYEFGAEYGISIESVLNEYTKMIITIPLRYDI
jgi:two-component system sensor histidine kinase YesM